MAALLARRPAGDRAFERMYQRHVRDVYHYTLAVLRNPADAEDVTQTVFMNAYRAFQQGQRPEQPKNWLIAIAHNACRQRFRQQQRRPDEVELLEDRVEAAVQDDDSYTADDIQRALGRLAFNQRAALVMRELEGRSYAEIAEIMGLSLPAIETLIFRGRRALREQLEGTLTCAQAELALSKQSDGMLSRNEKGQLRAHLRECADCASLSRRQRATRSSLKALAAIPLPGSLTSFFGGGGGAGTAAVGAGLATKAAAVVCAGAVVGGVGYQGVTHLHQDRVAAADAARSKHSAQAPIATSSPAALPVIAPAPRAPTLRTAHARSKAAHDGSVHAATAHADGRDASTQHGKARGAGAAGRETVSEHGNPQPAARAEQKRRRVEAHAARKAERAAARDSRKTAKVAARDVHKAAQTGAREGRKADEKVAHPAVKPATQHAHTTTTDLTTTSVTTTAEPPPGKAQLDEKAAKSRENRNERN